MAMRRNIIIKLVFGLALLAVAAILLYQVPSIHDRLDWRKEIAIAYVRGIIYPADRMPTVAPVTLAATDTPTQAPTETTAATLEPTATLPPTATPTPEPLPTSVALTPPEYEKQGANSCGPASLSAYLRFYGWKGDQKVIDEVVKPSAEDRNVNVEELVYFVRNNVGWLNVEYRVGGSLERIKRFLANGIPVMIEEGMHLDETYWPNDDHWAGHYLFITGYDEASQVFITQDTFYGPDQKVPYATLEKNWEVFNHVYIMIYHPDQEQTVKNLVADDWDLDANRTNALNSSKEATEKDPKDAFAWFNLGTNLVYFERYAEASQAYDKSREIGLPQRMLRYQFGPFIAYFHTGRVEDLMALTEYAIQRTSNSEEALLWHGWGLYRKGDKAGALADFNKALADNPNYEDAKYAINFLNGN